MTLLDSTFFLDKPEDAETKRAKLTDVRLIQTAPPQHEKADYMVGDCTSINRGLEEELDFKMVGNIRKMDESSLRFHMLQATVYGNKLITAKTPTNKFVSFEMEDSYLVTEPHILNIISESANGFHKVHTDVRDLMAQNKRKLGVSRRARVHGFEDKLNDAYNESAPIGLPYVVEPNTPLTDKQNINGELVDPIPVYIS
jgi:hypothetical protein